MEIGPILRAMKRNKVRFGLILVEVALSLAIIVSCVTLVRKAKSEIATPSGFADDEIIHVSTSPFDASFKEYAHFNDVIDHDFAAILRIPGVKSVSNTRFLPWQGGGSSGEVRILGSKTGFLRVQQYNADESTFDVLGSDIIEGRGFTHEEVARETVQLRKLFATPRERNAAGTMKEPYLQDVVMSRAFAEHVFGDPHAVGKMLEDADGDHYRVIGIIDKFHNPFGLPVHDYGMFFTTRSFSYEGGASYLVRADAASVASVRQQLEGTLLGVDAGRAVKVQTLLEVRAKYHGGNTLVVRVLSGVIVLVMFITFIGIVGLTSFSVAERTRQIGTRRALGAQRLDIVKHFLLENWLVTTMGVFAGIPLTVVLNIFVVARLSGERVEPRSIVLACILLWSAGLLATLFPALRGAAVPPATATRNV